MSILGKGVKTSGTEKGASLLRLTITVRVSSNSSSMLLDPAAG